LELNEIEYYQVISDCDIEDRPEWTDGLNKCKLHAQKKQLQMDLQIKRIEKVINNITEDIIKDNFMQSKFEHYVENLRFNKPRNKLSSASVRGEISPFNI
jgi:hypothetical protein